MKPMLKLVESAVLLFLEIRIINIGFGCLVSKLT